MVLLVEILCPSGFSTIMICPSCSFNNVPGADQCLNCNQDLAQFDQPEAIDRVERSLKEDTVASLPPHAPVTVAPTATIKEAIALFLAHDMGALPILDEGGALVGILTERDLLDKAAGTDGYSEHPVSKYMTPRPVTVRETDTLAFALHKMDSGGYRHLPVLRDDRLVGIISVRDLLRHVKKLCKA